MRWTKAQKEEKKNCAQSKCWLFCWSGRPKDGISALKDVKSKEDTSSDSEDKMAAINKNLSFGKRKPELLMDGGEVVEKRKKGRPRKDKMAAPIAQPFTQVERWREKMNRQMEVSVIWYITEFQEILINPLYKHQ